MLALMTYGSFVFSLFLVSGYYFGYGRPQHLLASSLIGIVLGFFGGVWWLRFMRKNLKDGVFNSGAFGTRSHVISFAVALLLCYFITRTKYGTDIYWVLCLTCISCQIYSVIAIVLLQHRTGQTIRYIRSKREIL